MRRATRLAVLAALALCLPQSAPRAAESGFPEAQADAYTLFQEGNRHLDGDGVPRDDAQAARLIRRAADQGLSEAQYSLGLLYQMGRGVSQDYGQAWRWFRKAADQGYGLAQIELGLLYELGQGASQSFEEAARWYRKAADQRDPMGRYLLGGLYEFGRGVTQDYAQAALWYDLASRQGNEDARRSLDRVRAALRKSPAAPSGRTLDFSVKMPPPPPEVPSLAPALLRPPAGEREAVAHAPAAPELPAKPPPPVPEPAVPGSRTRWLLFGVLAATVGVVLGAMAAFRLQSRPPVPIGETGGAAPPAEPLLTRAFAVANRGQDPVSLKAEFSETWLEVRPGILALGPGMSGEFSVSLDRSRTPRGAQAKIRIVSPRGVEAVITVVAESAGSPASISPRSVDLG